MADGTANGHPPQLRDEEVPFTLKVSKMNRLICRVAVMILFATPFLSAAAEETRPYPTRGKLLLDCSVFFGLMSQPKSEISEGMTTFAFAATSYATVEFANERQVEIETEKSMALLMDELPSLRENQETFKNKLDTCFSALKAAEVELRPKMDEVLREFVPEIFGGD